MSGLVSPPPMMMPTPIHQSSSYPAFLPGMTSPLLMQAAGGPADQSAGPPAAMAFTYVPIPVYNLGGMSMTGTYTALNLKFVIFEGEKS